ncbi:MAG: DUF2218 domain-containing protein [Hyphomicrobiales bacterium]|nr:DUF2218 domain-containing protein [Hyphomicrobiales bacterium]
MPSSTARITSASSRKYMIQLCKHWSHKLTVEWDERNGRIEFDPSRKCLLQTDGDHLDLRVETASGEELERTQNTVVNHLKRFAFREDFGDIAWTREG